MNECVKCVFKYSKNKILNLHPNTNLINWGGSKLIPIVNSISMDSKKTFNIHI